MSICVYQGKFSLFLFLFNSIFDIRESFAIFRFFSSILQPAFIRACIYFGRDYLESLQNHYIIHEEYLQKIFRKKKLNLLIVFRYCCLFVCLLLFYNHHHRHYVVTHYIIMCIGGGVVVVVVGFFFHPRHLQIVTNIIFVFAEKAAAQIEENV